ncbi:hypothetical protein PROFUN_09605, partial [Planoprotostelium fungivorum]
MHRLSTSLRLTGAYRHCNKIVRPSLHVPSARGLKTVPSLEIFQRAVRFQERKAIRNNPNVDDVSKQITYTYADLLEHSEALHHDMKQKGLLKSDDNDPPRIAVLCESGYDYVRAQWAVWRAGAIFVPLCTTHPAAEMEYVLQNARVSGALCDSHHWNQFHSLAEKNGVKSIRLDSVEPQFSKLKDEKTETFSISRESPAMIIYTSGTTGKPKGVLTTHKNTEAQILSMHGPWGWKEEDHILHVLTTSLWSGALCEMMPKFNPKQ